METVAEVFQTKVKTFYDEIRRGVITASRCRTCKTLYLPPRADCKECYSSDMVSEIIESPQGKLLTYTVISSPPESFTEKAPYTIGVVQIDNGLRVTGWVEAKESDRLTIGAQVEILPHQDEDGRLGFLIKSVPALPKR